MAKARVELDENGFYQIRIYEKVEPETSTIVVNGERQSPKANTAKFELVDIILLFELLFPFPFLLLRHQREPC